jgi:hypothetical protein
MFQDLIYALKEAAMVYRRRRQLRRLRETIVTPFD